MEQSQTGGATPPPTPSPVQVTVYARVGDSPVLNELAVVETEGTIEPIVDRESTDHPLARNRHHVNIIDVLAKTAEAVAPQVDDAEPGAAVNDQTPSTVDADDRARRSFVAIASMADWWQGAADKVLERMNAQTNDDVMLYHDAVSVLTAARSVFRIAEAHAAGTDTQQPYVFCEVWRRIDGRSCILAPGHAGTHAFSRHGGARPAEEAR